MRPAARNPVARACVRAIARVRLQIADCDPVAPALWRLGARASHGKLESEISAAGLLEQLDLLEKEEEEVCRVGVEVV